MSHPVCVVLLWQFAQIARRKYVTYIEKGLEGYTLNEHSLMKVGSIGGSGQRKMLAQNLGDRFAAVHCKILSTFLCVRKIINFCWG